MKIIIEGPNNVGKSTFIKKLLERPTFKHYEVEHLSHKTPNDYNFHKDLLDLPQDMIFDRFYLGEVIYSEIYGRKPKLDTNSIIKLGQIYKESSLIIILDADYEFIIQSNINKGESFNYDEVKLEKAGFYNMRKLLESKGLSIYYYKNHKEGEADYNKFIDMIENLVIDKESELSRSV